MRKNGRARGRASVKIKVNERQRQYFIETKYNIVAAAHIHIQQLNSTSSKTIFPSRASQVNHFLLCIFITAFIFQNY